MKKVLIVTPYRNARGGVESVTKILSSVLVQNEYEVDYLTIENKNNFSLWLKLQILIWGNPAITRAHYKAFNQNEYEAVICNGEFGLGINHKKAINYFHGSYLGLRDATFDVKNLKSFFALTFRSFQQKISSKNKIVVSVSDYLNAILEKQKIKVNFTVPNPVDLSRFRPAETKKEGDLLFVGRGDYYAKGFDVLEKLAQRGHLITCVTDIKWKNGNINFIPMQEYYQMPAIYSRFKILILPSRFESFGMAAVEAMASGLPIIMNNVGVATQLKKEIPEFVVDDLDDLLEIEKRIKIIKDRYLEFSQRARSFCEKNFSLEKYGQDWLRIISDKVGN